MRQHLCKLLFFIIGILFFRDLKADSTKQDSLLRVFKKLPVTFAGDTARIKILVELGRILNNDKAAIGYLNQALNLAQRRNWARGLMIVTCRTGFHYGRMSLDYRACEYLFKGLRLAELQKDDAYIGFAYRFLGDNHSDLGLYEKGMQFQFKALPHLYKAKDYLRYLTSIHNIGLDYLSLHNNDKAINYFHLCLEKNKKFKLNDVDGLCFTNLAVAFENKGNLDSALQYLDQYKKISISIPDDLAGADIEIARILYRKGQTEKALIFTKAASSRKQMQRTNTQKVIHEMFYKIYQKQQKFRQAFYHLLELTRLQNLNTLDMQKKQLESLKFYYENEKQKSRIALLQVNIAQRNLERNFLIAGLWGGGIFIVFLFLGIYLINRKSHKIETQRNQIMEIKEELDQTNHQLKKFNNTLEEKVLERTNDLTIANQELIVKNREIKEAFFNGQSLERKRVASELHDNLGGTISALKWQFESLETESLNNHEKTIYDSVLSMMEVAYADVRNISHNLMPQELEKEGLSTALQNLVDDLTRSGRIGFIFKSNYPASFLPKQKEMEIYGICLELINNILKHSRASKASLELNKLEEKLVITISDNGIGIPQLRADKKNGMGLKNLRNRIAGINGLIEIGDVDPSGTAFVITIYSDLAAES